MDELEQRRKDEQEKKENLAKMQKEAEANARKKAAAEKDAAAATPAAAPTPWTIEQQKQMEVGMKQFGADMGVKERWIAIAGTIEGKNAKACYTRFRELCAKAKEGK